jgi:hypothetical protein
MIKALAYQSETELIPFRFYRWIVLSEMPFDLMERDKNLYGF